MEYWKETLQKEYVIQTVFLGGGTPTCLHAEELLQIGRKLSELPLALQACKEGKEKNAVPPFLNLRQKQTLGLLQGKKCMH